MKVIINADDFGFSKSINQGIIDAYKKGLISSTTMMMNMPYVEDAVKLAKENPGLGVGVHLNVTVGHPLSKNIPSLVDENNVFYYIENFRTHIVNENEAYQEMKAQIEEIIHHGIMFPTHIDCHHELVYNETFRKVMLKLAKEYQIPIRIMDNSMKEECQKAGIRTVDYFYEDFFKDNATVETLVNIIENNQNDLIEIMCHIGYMDEDTINRTKYRMREKEIEELLKFKELGYYQKFQLVTY